uniref:Gamma-aminobutyric acid receptor subunit beta n=9 Tax=Tetranychus TaxID=32263 RepID=T1L3N9_TETUR|nr:GABA gated chloride channel RDL3 [Tetranychus cinnabarinus]
MINRLNQWIFVLIIVMFNKFNHIFTLSDFDVGDKGNALGQNITRILNAFFAGGYDKRVRPNYGGPPVEIGVSMHIISISTVSEVQMDFTSDFYFRQFWEDPRLAFIPLPRITELYVGAEVADRIWVPDTFFANEKSASFHFATTKNTFLRIGSNGEVFRSIRLTVTASCPMELQYFPMDRQKCSLEIESYGYSMSDMIYIWREGKKSIRMNSDLSLPQFKVLGHAQKSQANALSTGNYSRLICEIKFARSLGFYLIQIYIPASLIVVISWVSFWLHRNATPARVSLGVTTVLTMTTLMSSTNAQLPKISYIKSIDVFLGTCFVMVFASLLEYATVGYLGKRIAMRKSRFEQMNKMHEDQKKRLASLPSHHNSNSTSGHLTISDRGGGGSGGATGNAGVGCLSNNQVALQSGQQQSQMQQQQSSQGGGGLSSTGGTGGCGGGGQGGQMSSLNPLNVVHPVQVTSCDLIHGEGGHSHLVPPSSHSHHPNQPQSQPQSQSQPPSSQDIPPPIPPGPIGIINPSLCPAAMNARNPRQIIYKHSHLYHPGSGGTLHRSGHYDRSYTCSSPPTTHRSTCTLRTCNTAHMICNHPDSIGSSGVHYPSEVRYKLSEMKTGSRGASCITTSTGEPICSGNSQGGGTGGSGGCGATSTTPLISRRSMEQSEPPPTPITKHSTGKCKNPNKLLGVSPSDIDKYSRVIFPVCFICFNLMYWIIYLHISNEPNPDLIQLGS